MPRLAIENVMVSDHRPIILSWLDRGGKKGYPFKFNCSHLQDPAFDALITSSWTRVSAEQPSLPFCLKLRAIKNSVKQWEAGRKLQDQQALLLIQQEIDHIMMLTAAAPLTFDLRSRILSLKGKRSAILKKQEASGDSKNAQGDIFVSQQDISREVVSHFQAQFLRRNNVDFLDYLWGIDLAPTIFDDDANKSISQPVSEEELLRIMKSFQKDKCPRPDGWTIEFFLHFFDIFKEDILSLVESSRSSGAIHPHTSSTLIALIQKNADPLTFKDFRPISLCNITFKIITKVIAERIKVYLAATLSNDQYAFLRGRSILDAVAITQECLFSLHVRKQAAAIMKIDLHKAFDCIDWGYLECLLAKIGLSPPNIRWIKACYSNVNYAVIVNGLPSPFFQAQRGLRQGCPLSPLLFILVINTLSLHINRAVTEGHIKAVNICRQVHLSHNLFVDDVLLFAMLCKRSWICYKAILDRFHRATGLFINKSKSILYHNDVELDTVLWIAQLFDISATPLSLGLKYLGYHLKPSGYSKHDWAWLIDRFYTRISAWEFRYLSLAGRVTLSQGVLLQLAVYWAHLFHLPIGILKQLQLITANFIWGGSKHRSKFHLARMNRIAVPKHLGDWGLKDLRIFGSALICKSLHRGIFGSGPWSKTIQTKYLKGRSLLFWTAEQLGLPPSLSPIWSQVILSLQAAGVARCGSSDHLRWSSSGSSATILVKDVYSDLIHSMAPAPAPFFPTSLWKTGCPPRMIFFAWLLFNNRNLTWDNLQKRSWHGPSICFSCESDVEINLHIFFSCCLSLELWSDLTCLYSFPHVLFNYVQEAFKWWSSQPAKLRPLLIITLWFIWRWRNHWIFDSHKSPFHSIMPCISSLFDSTCNGLT
eukprot:PITA_12614